MSIGGDRFDIVVRDSAGIEIVENHVSDRTANRVALVETLRIGKVSGEAPELFDRITAIEVAADGRILVGNNGTATVREFDADGAFLNECGGRGSGPGELRSVTSLVLAGPDVAVVSAADGGRLVIFGRDGDLKATHVLQTQAGLLMFPLALTPDGWVGTATDPNPAVRQSEPGRAYPRDIGIHRIDPASGTVGPVVHDVPPIMFYGVRAADPPRLELFAARTAPAVDGAASFYWIMDERYRIEKHAAGGGLVRVITRDHDPIPITDEDVEDLINLLGARMDTISWVPLDVRRTAKAEMVETVRSQAALPHPATRPAITDITVSRDGTVWVRRADRQDVASWEASRRTGMERLPVADEWDVFDPAGRYVATVETPPRFTAMAAARNALYGVLKDDLDVEYVVRLELPEEVAPAGMVELPPG